MRSAATGSRASPSTLVPSCSSGRCSTSTRETLRVLVLLYPTARKQPLRALDMRATVDREEFFGFQHGDGRLQLIERLAAAYRAGELPDYMLEFVESLKTRATAATS